MVHPKSKLGEVCKFEERQSNSVGARDVYERAVEFFGEENADEKLFLAFGKFEENCKEELYKAYTQHEKKYGDKGGIEDVIVSKRKFQYEEEVKTNPNNYDAWFDYLRLMESEADSDSVREVYERAIANVPPAEEKRLWRRYIYLWINYGLYEELIAKDMERTRQVYRACLDLVPHKKFTFGKGMAVVRSV
ncbi:Crooked neck-like protein 1 [Desmophyllum pertusum]|uniref:Crooked neck-like protein 1 n=1 Tax=Desmophyllum pertusum TaxID=174260 RepID=A0A9X0CWW6_9CNID|nr:Crooked neck-like protein 1 [Desmophyllum pertusum]